MDATRAFRQREECRLVGNADVARGGQLLPAPDRRSVQRGDRGETPMAKQGESSVPGAGAVEHLRRLPRAELLEVDAGREAGAVTENHRRAGLVLSPAHRRLERGQKGVANSVALVRPI